METKSTDNLRPTLFLSLPGGFPGLPNIGVEIVFDSIRNSGGIPCDIIRSDLFCCNFVRPELLNKIADLDIVDFFYADEVFHDYRSEHLAAKRNEYLASNKLSQSEIRDFHNALKKLERQFSRYIREQRPKILAVSVNSDRLITALRFIRIARKIDPNIRVIAGGPLIQGEIGLSVFSEFKDIDFLVYGRGDFVTKDLLGRIYSGESIDSVLGILSRNGNTVRHHQEPSCRLPYRLPEMKGYYEDLNELTRRYGRKAFGVMYGIAVVVSVSCWWKKCDFCSESNSNQIYALQDPEVVADYVQTMSTQHHISELFFLDMIQPPAPYLKRLCDLLKDHRIPYRISAEIHATIEDSDLEMLFETGLKRVQIGIESYSQEHLKKMDKGTQVGDILRVLLKCAKWNVAAQGNLLMHHPLESKKDVLTNRTIINLTSHLLIPYLQNYFVAHGSLLSSDLKSSGTRTYPLRKHSLLYPPKLRRKLVFSYRYLPQNSETRYSWKRLQEFVSETSHHTPKLMYVDGIHSIQIVDTRSVDSKSYYLDGRDRDIILACSNITTFRRLGFGDDPEISERIGFLLEIGILIQLNETLLNLAIPWERH